MAELATQATEEREHQLPVADGVAELGKRGGHRLETATVVSDAQGVLAEVAELRFEEERAGLPLAEELILEVAPVPTSGSLPHHQGLLQIVGDSAIDPRQDDAICLHPCRARGEGLIFENVASQGIFAKDGEEHVAPLVVGVRGVIEDDGDEGLDVDDGSGLCPKGLVGALVRVQRGGAEMGLLGTACFFSAGFGLSREAMFFGGGPQRRRHPPLGNQRGRRADQRQHPVTRSTTGAGDLVEAQAMGPAMRPATVSATEAAIGSAAGEGCGRVADRNRD